MDEEKLSQIFIPDISKDNDNLLNSNLNLAYYTSAGTLFSILKYKQLWLRSTMCMNDYQEIKYAFEYVKATLYDNNSTIFSEYIIILAKIMNLPEKEVITKFNELVNNIFGGSYLHTYIMCFSEHDEGNFPDGNLQIFNSYGRGNGACVVFDKERLKDLYLPIFKVHYFEKEEIRDRIEELLKRLAENSQALCTVENNDLLNYLKLFFIHLIVTTKHPGFSQEREWRLVVNTKLLNYNVVFKNALTEEVECINMVPQIIKKLEISGYENVLHKIILEPRYDLAAEVLAVKKLLGEKWHINDTNEIVRVSEIPIRR